MKELRNFHNSGNKNNNGRTNLKQDNFEESRVDRQKLNEALNKYQGWDEDALINELLANVNRQKQQGIFDKQQLRRFVDTMGNLITQEQREKLNNLIKVIDEQE